MAATKNKKIHLTHEERQTVEMGIKNGFAGKSVGDTPGKDITRSV